MSDDLIKEIKEDIRNDQLVAFWNEYGNIVIGTVIAVVLMTVGYLFWHNLQEKKILEQTLMYERNLEIDPSKGEKADYTPLIKDGSTGYRILGSFEQARLASGTKEAEDLLKSMADDTSYDSFYREAAALQAIMRKFDSTHGAVLLEELEPLVNKASPLQAAALELQAFSYLKLQQTKKASDVFLSVAKHPQAPQSMRVRAQAMLETIN
ncbi:MAG: tetratricopeptide repeat protein [Alphaproteobacteria bacterium]|nr:tetratricopeptide repeat protein [Alphaproteobacteria bacterium]